MDDIKELPSQNYMLRSDEEYFYRFEGENWHEFGTMSNGKTYNRVREIHAGIKLGKYEPRFKTEKPYPFGY